eukprot:TRINITY_DN59625_c0_g2_i1.p1 TRINITY_DN59625_c0_g2~~TRINITY_DN59625_c0_g2_i1.p1  ORF type:complete len:437 (-),score=26.82 TRINITY_DN59625_c0_g2_i1:123-1433(-)
MKGKHKTVLFCGIVLLLASLLHVICPACVPLIQRYAHGLQVDPSTSLTPLPLVHSPSFVDDVNEFKPPLPHPQPHQAAPTSDPHQPELVQPEIQDREDSAADSDTEEEKKKAKKRDKKVGKKQGKGKAKPQVRNFIMNMTMVDALLATKSKEKPLIVGMANGAFVDMALNFLCSLKRFEYDNVVIFSDEEAATSFAKHGYETAIIDAHSDIGVFSGRRFAGLTRKKVHAVAHVLKKGFDILFFDTDIVVLRDIYGPLLSASKTGGPILDGDTEVGHVEYPPKGEHTESGWDYAINYYVNHTNTAFYFMKANPRTIQLMENWEACIDRVSRSKADDQDVLDGIVDMELTGPRFNRLSTYGVIKMCADLKIHLPRLLLESNTRFPSGGDFFVTKIPQGKGIKPYMVHNNQIHGTKLKIQRFKKFGLWLLDLHSKCKER